MKVEVFKVGGGLESSKASEHETVSRVSFEVPFGYTKMDPIQQKTVRGHY